jgi:hypothetical protein
VYIVAHFKTPIETVKVMDRKAWRMGGKSQKGAFPRQQQGEIMVASPDTTQLKTKPQNGLSLNEIRQNRVSA